MIGQLSLDENEETKVSVKKKPTVLEYARAKSSQRRCRYMANHLAITLFDTPRGFVNTSGIFLHLVPRRERKLRIMAKAKNSLCNLLKPNCLCRNLK